MVDLVKQTHPDTPFILYISGSAGVLERMARTGVDIISLDWTVDMAEGLARLPEHVGVQGNVDPGLLFGTPEAIQVLLDAGADIKARNKDGEGPLHLAALWGASGNAQALLDAGADVMARDEDGSTPLHWAAWDATPANIQALLDAGADAKAKNKEGKTPWDLAQENEKLKGTKAYWALNDAQYN